jgi:hypothetical protein
MKVKAHVMSFVLACGLFALAGGSAKKNTNPGESTSTSSQTDPGASSGAGTKAAAPPASPKPEKVFEKVTAATLINDYKANEVRADNKWKDHNVAVTGIVSNVSKDAFGGIYVLLGTGAQFEINEVHCQFPRKLASQAAALSKGDKVTINGKVTGMVIASVMLDDAEVAGAK